MNNYSVSLDNMHTALPLQPPQTTSTIATPYMYYYSRQELFNDFINFSLGYLLCLRINYDKVSKNDKQFVSDMLHYCMEDFTNKKLRTFKFALDNNLHYNELVKFLSVYERIKFFIIAKLLKDKPSIKKI